MFRKILVANRGEIAVRAFRAATELGVGTVAVFPYEDRFAEYRLKADESYQIGEVGHPVRAYLDVEGIIRAAKDAGVDAIYPGYGFLSENPDLAQACEDNDIAFVGPNHKVLELTGDKAAAIAAAHAAGLPTLRGSDPSDDPATLIAASADFSFPVFVKASPAVADAACAGWSPPRAWRPRSTRRCVRRRRPSVTPGCTLRRRCSARGTSRCRSWPTRTAA